MPIFPYDEEERRRRMLTPGINPNASLPDVLMPKRPLPPPVANPGAMPAPTYNPQDMAPPSRYQRLESEKQGYMRATPGRGKSALTGALEGFLSGGGLAGAATGAIYGAADPRGLRERRFERLEKPKLMERFGYEDQERAAARQAENDALNNQYRQAQIGELESQAYKNRLPPPAPRPRSPVHSDRGLYDPEAGAIISGTEPLPTAPKTPTPHWVRDASGNYVDLNAPQAQNQPRKPIRGYDRPRAPKEPKAEGRPKPGSKGSATKEDIDAAFRAAGGHAAGWTLKGMKKHLKDKGYTVPE